MKTYIKLILLILFISGCSSLSRKARNEQIMNSWIMQSKSDLVRQLGRPQYTYRVDAETMVYVYEFNNNRPFVMVQELCETHFFTTNDIITEARVKGWRCE